MREPRLDVVPPWALAVSAMFSVQLASALAVPMIGEIGAPGTAWLRLALGAVVFVLVQRPPLGLLRRTDVPVVVALGIATGVMTVAFMEALDRIPLGMAVAVEFLGPLTVAAVRSPHRRALVWPALALVGVVLMTEPWRGQVDVAGLGFAALAGGGWGGYILLTQRIGDRFTGIGSLSMTVPIAALTVAVVGVPKAAAHLTPALLAEAAVLALLMPVLPFVLELLALRRMTHTAFGTLMALEPAIGLVWGAVLLDQTPSVGQLVGITVVVLAGAAAQRGGRRTSAEAALTDVQPV
ncbi:EamA family transporter [Nocardioides jiangxiensis]|uniref:EamA family transporter n=1 Tax=Nocardioides jiangxiensis TaxID=3064524 RepID=A0ABT9B0H2_9ACTN|nr:EamA family transporter [Nocardioides sp. WY-20]MDO7868225.1 EamA family transporter [Nocardioides sp. WY-20]